MPIRRRGIIMSPMDAPAATPPAAPRASFPVFAEIGAELQRDAAGSRLAAWIFLRLLGLVYFFAFGSLAMQIRGLVGERGILPIASYLNGVYSQLGPKAYERLPTLLWLGHSDAALVAICIAGAGLGILIVADVATAFCLAGACALFLSIMLGGQLFLDFQWDAMLVEAGFLAIFLAPWRWLPAWGARFAADPAPPWPALWMLRWLLFRLFFASGCVKLISGDPHWQDLSALAYHYESQPLPTAGGWLLFQAPLWFQKVSALFMFYVELIAPFSIFAPRPIRRIGCALMIILQTLIALSGNFAFFSLITIAVCVLMLDDDFLRAIGRRFRPASKPAPPMPRVASRIQRLSAGVVAIALFPCTLAVLTQLAGGRIPRIPIYAPLQDALYFDFHLVGNYGPFASVGVGRREIVIEGSNDGAQWQEYHWRWKPDALERGPGFVAPFHPRLDWQMWFAALGHPSSIQMLERLMQRLLQGSPEVAALMKPSPFPEDPPKYLRAIIYDYHMTSWTRLRQTGRWWTRDRKRTLIPAITLESFGDRR